MSSPIHIMKPNVIDVHIVRKLVKAMTTCI